MAAPVRPLGRRLLGVEQELGSAILAGGAEDATTSAGAGPASGQQEDGESRYQATRSANENANGRIRWYFPKGTDFAKLTRAEIKQVELAINSRPMKCLSFRTPLVPPALLHFNVECAS